MINFEDEVKNFRPLLEMEQLEEYITNSKIVDISDIMNEIRKIKQDKLEQRGVNNEMS